MAFVRIAGYPMDLAISEGHSFPGEVTKYPVEVGADVSDHIRDLPPEITLECIVSNIVPGELVDDPQRGQVVEGPDGILETVLPREEALAKLRELKALRRTVTIETSLGKFDSMAFVSLDVPVDKDKNNALFFTAKFSKFNQVTNNRTRVRVKSSMAGAGGKAKVKVVAGSVMAVDTTVIWQHGIANGTFVGGTSVVEVHYNRPKGMTRDEALALGGAAPDSSLIDYFDQGSATPITGQRRADLVADLKKQAELNSVNADKGLGPNAQLRKDRNLPPGVSLDRFQRQVPSTLGPTQQDLDNLQNRFGRQIAPTFPGS